MPATLEEQSQTQETVYLRVMSPWGEELVLELPPPKPDLPVNKGPYHRPNQRCQYHQCNRLYSIAERGNKAYCCEEHYEAERAYRRKMERAGVDPAR